MEEFLQKRHSHSQLNFKGFPGGCVLHNIWNVLGLKKCSPCLHNFGNSAALILCSFVSFLGNIVTQGRPCSSAVPDGIRATA